MNSQNNSVQPSPEDVALFNAEVAKIAERDGISLEEAAENLAALLVNIEEHGREIYTLRIAFEDLQERVSVLERG